jgi:NAD(P)-dependent dehydrogenase (short-subunit alcohol dehydrogenase family)
VNQLDTFRLDGRVAFVSGGGGAIGSALATGARRRRSPEVAVADIDQARVDAAAAEKVRTAGAKCLALAGTSP